MAPLSAAFQAAKGLFLHGNCRGQACAWSFPLSVELSFQNELLQGNMEPSCIHPLPQFYFQNVKRTEAADPDLAKPHFTRSSSQTRRQEAFRVLSLARGLCGLPNTAAALRARGPQSIESINVVGEP